jgi:predicted O-methyltransferase YrrM
VTPTFNECWFDVGPQQTLAELVRSTANIDGIVVEIGAWEGRSTVVMAEAAHPRTVHTCDTWNGSPSDASGQLAAERDVFAQWSANVEPFDNVIGHRMDWREFVGSLTDPVAFCFIDAEHTYAEVFDNIHAIVPLMPAGAVLCGDDLNCPDVSAAVSSALGVHRNHGPMWSWVKP